MSLALTTYQAGKLLLLGLSPEGTLSVFNRTLSRCMGLCATADTLYLSTLFQLWRFENSLTAGQRYQSYDRLYVPHVGYTTGDLDIHDVALDSPGQPVFANTLFSCLATVSERYSFIPLWQPPFVSKLAAEDRCHLNGLALDAGGEPRYVTCVSGSDVADGWREHRQQGGVLIDVKQNEVILGGLSMPHSPRLYRDKLWLLDSGRGEFGYVDLTHGCFEPVAFCPGYAGAVRRKTAHCLPLAPQLERLYMIGRSLVNEKAVEISVVIQIAQRHIGLTKYLAAFARSQVYPRRR